MSSTEFTGGPPSPRDRAWGVLAPRGGAVMDGARLAAINAIAIVGALILITVVSLIARALDWLLPIPVLLVTLTALVALVVVGILIAWRYALEHVKVARLQGREVRADLFGAIAALPFVAISLLLLMFGLFSLLLSVLTVNGGRALDALQRMGFGVLFLMLAGGMIVVARFATESERR